MWLQSVSLRGREGEETSANQSPLLKIWYLVSILIFFNLLPSIIACLYIPALGGRIPGSNLTGERTASRVILYYSSTGAVLGGGANSARSIGTFLLKEKRKKDRRIGLPYAYDAITIHHYRGFIYSRRTPPSPPILHHISQYQTALRYIPHSTPWSSRPLNYIQTR